MSAFDEWYTEEMEAEIFTQGVEESLENAFNAGLEAAANVCVSSRWNDLPIPMHPDECANAIRALKGG